ncbi:MAG: hypothetical protein ABW039_02845 [Sphingobium sp.]
MVTMLPAEGAEGASLSIVALGGALLASAMLVAALHRTARRHDLTGIVLGASGILAALGATLFVHDVVNLPETLGILSVGTGTGYLLARRGTFPPPARLAPLLHLLGAIATLMACTAAWINPAAFGVDAASLPLVALASLCGIALVVAGLFGGGRAHRWLGAGSGAAAASLGFALGNPALILCGGIIGSAALALARRRR